MGWFDAGCAGHEPRGEGCVAGAGYAAEDAGADGVVSVKAAHAEAKALRGADVVIPREQIADVEMKRPTLLTNGNLIVTTTRGRRYQLHFLRKHAPDFEALHAALVSHPAT